MKLNFLKHTKFNYFPSRPFTDPVRSLVRKVLIFSLSAVSGSSKLGISTNVKCKREKQQPKKIWSILFIVGEGTSFDYMQNRRSNLQKQWQPSIQTICQRNKGWIVSHFVNMGKNPTFDKCLYKAIQLFVQNPSTEKSVNFSKLFCRHFINKQSRFVVMKICSFCQKKSH